MPELLYQFLGWYIPFHWIVRDQPRPKSAKLRFGVKLERDHIFLLFPSKEPPTPSAAHQCRRHYLTNATPTRSPPAAAVMEDNEDHDVPEEEDPTRTTDFVKEIMGKVVAPKTHMHKLSESCV